jgi:hypothetical protein
MFRLFKCRRTTRKQDFSLHPPPNSQTEEITIEDDAPLCSTCSAIDLRAILRYVIPRRHAVPLGHLTNIFDNCDQCGLCRLVTTFIRRMWRLDELPGIDLAGITCALYTVESSTLQGLRDVHHHRLYIDTSHRPQHATLSLITTQSPLSLELQLLEEDASKVGRTKEFHGRRVSRNVNISLLKRWIHICENEHRERCELVWWRTGEVLPKSVRVLDVARMAIVSAPPGCRYVALSYVWGGPGESYWTTKANIKKRRVPGGLDTSVLPDTISDVIQLVRQLGERYLWIDALCIVQDDPKDKGVQISAMDLIYGSSAFTVFAAGGTSVRDPLPGIRSGTRDPQQQVAKIQGFHLAVPLTFLSEAIISSTWNQRGWTYQELMLSRRRIFFTAHQVYFECGADMWCEGVVAEPVDYPWVARYMFDGGAGAGSLTSAPLSWGNQAYLRDYMGIIRQYTQRKLTVESDILDAIGALFKALTKAYKVAGGDYGEAFRFGMPCVDLAQALLWQPTANASHSRRPADGIGAPWPSWSWVGWRGAARYNSVSVLVNIQTGPETSSAIFVYESLVHHWYIVDDGGRPVRQDVRHSGRTGEVHDANSSTYIAPKGDINPQQLLVENAPLQPGALVFRTTSARFGVTRAHDVAGADVMTNYAVYSILSDFLRPSTLVGRVILPCLTPTDSPTSYEFIVLSRADHCGGLYDENVLRKPYFGCMLHVMAVQKTQDERMMERVGVGVIVEQAWLDSTAEEKIVFLG